VLLEAYPALSPPERQDVLQTLAARPEWAAALLDAVESQHIPSADLTAFTARQLQSLGDARLTARVRQLWGEVRDTPAERTRQIETYRKRLTPAVLAQADPVAGRQQFQKLCANCHKLFGEGGTIGPDITGSQRKNLDYLLENLLDPSAAVARDYQMDVLLTDSGRVITGLVVGESDAALTVQTVNERIVVPKAEIESRQKSPLSLMPDGMLQQLSTAQVRDLMAYLMGDRQVPLPEAPVTGQ
jgi:putative heme-binding domain-containing protein